MTKLTYLNYQKLLKNEPELFGLPDDPIQILHDELSFSEAERSLNKQAEGLETPGHSNLGVIHEDSYFRVLRDPVKFPGGQLGGYTRVLNAKGRPPGAVVLAYNGDRLALIRQFRHAVRGWRWEAPRGFGEANEDAFLTASRELQEETGLETISAEIIGSIEPDTGVIGTRCHVIVANVASETSIQNVGHAEEAISATKFLSPTELKKLILDGQLIDGLTLAALTLKECRN